MKREDFLRTTALATATIGINQALGNSISTFFKTTGAGGGSTPKPFGIQLWTLKEDMHINPKTTLQAVAKAGYKQIETFEGKAGIFWGMKPREYKKLVSDLGMTTVAAHCDISKDFEKKASESASIGIKYLICPYKGPQQSIDSFKKFADEFNKCGEVCKKHGIHFAYHNHDYSFKPLDGVVPQALLLQSTDPALVSFEMDIYWVTVAGNDPEEWMKKYPNRFRLCHIKDLRKTENGQSESTLLGKGTIPFESILQTALNNGMQYFITEQEAFQNITPLQTLDANAAYMKNIMAQLKMPNKTKS